MNNLTKESAGDAILVIDATARKYSNARGDLALLISAYEDELMKLRRRLLPAIKRAAAEAATVKDELARQLTARPDLFVKPRTMVLHGIKVGFQKGKGKITFADEEKLVERIRAQLPKSQAEALLKVETKPILAALVQLDGAVLKKLGVTITETGDAVVISAANGDVDKLVARLLEEAGKADSAKEAA